LTTTKKVSRRVDGPHGGPSSKSFVTALAQVKNSHLGVVHEGKFYSLPPNLKIKKGQIVKIWLDEKGKLHMSRRIEAVPGGHYDDTRKRGRKDAKKARKHEVRGMRQALGIDDKSKTDPVNVFEFDIDNEFEE